MKKTFFYFLFLFFVAASGFAASPLFREILLNTGVTGEKIPVSGTGSMYPTFPKSEGVTDNIAGSQIVSEPFMYRYPGGVSIFGKNYFGKKLSRGDIVEFENAKTDKITEEKYGRESGFVKRVVATGGDELELRDGYVYINNKAPKEPYIAKPRSTYGGDFLADCTKLTIPDDSVFVMGDNRKASLDSRFELGLVKTGDISYFLPLDRQDLLKNNWRNTADDFKLSRQGTLDTAEFVNSLNVIRKQKKISAFLINTRLNNSASIRGKIMLDTDDFSVNATQSGVTLEKAIRRSDYRNIIFAEVFTKGFYEAPELLENLFEFPDTKKLLLSDEYQDIGMSVNLEDVKGCPTQVTVIHLGGYKAPNYNKKDIEGWKSLIDNLKEILPSWENLKNVPSVDQSKVDSLLSLLRLRLANAQRIHDRLNKNEWLTEEEKKLLDLDSKLQNDAEKLISELNG